MLRMKHPDHGWHHAYTKSEEEAMRKAGWVEAEAVVIPPNATRPNFCIQDDDDGGGGKIVRKKPGPKPKAK